MGGDLHKIMGGNLNKIMVGNFQKYWELIYIK